MGTIRLQNIDGYLYPTDAVSAGVLAEEYDLGRIPEESLYLHAPRLVRDGHALAITDYTPTTSTYNVPYSPKIGGTPHSVINPCAKCRLNGICVDECGRKLFRLHTNH